MPAPAVAPPVARGAALVLEADPEVRALLIGALNGVGLTVTAGEPAQSFNALFDLRPALIVSDLKAPGAVDLLMAVRMDSLLLAIPFLFIADLPPEQAMALLPGVDSGVRYAKKPLEAAKVEALAAELLGPS